MIRAILGLLGHKTAQKMISKHTQGSRFDLRLGYAMLRDNRVPLKYKALAIGIGAGLTGLLLALELVPEFLAAVTPIIGLVADIMFDGLEVVIVPVVVGCLSLPFLAPRELVNQIMGERSAVKATAQPANVISP